MAIGVGVEDGADNCRLFGVYPVIGVALELFAISILREYRNIVVPVASPPALKPLAAFLSNASRAR